MNNKNNVHCSVQRKSDFSIEHILTKAGCKNNSDNQNAQSDGLLAFSWLHCTRYCPPKLPRTQKKEGPQKRQLGRHPRIPFSSQQLSVLEDKFKESPYLSSAEVTQLSRTLNLADIRVKIWFQNRRARERREKQEPEVQYLKPYTKETTQKSSARNIVPSIPVYLSPTTSSQTEPYQTFLQQNVHNSLSVMSVASIPSVPFHHNNYLPDQIQF